MRFLLNLSFRYKVPLWGSLLIVATAMIISSTLLLRSYGELKSDLLRDAATQGRTMAATLFSAILHDQVWRAYEIIKAPFGRESGDGPRQVESLVVVDQQGQVYVSTNPESVPMLANFMRLSPEFASLAGIVSEAGRETRVLEPEGSDVLFVATPIREEQAHLGTLVQIYSKKVLRARFQKSAEQAALITFLVIVLLLPLGWYWGARLFRCCGSPSVWRNWAGAYPMTLRPSYTTIKTSSGGCTTPITAPCMNCAVKHRSSARWSIPSASPRSAG